MMKDLVLGAVAYDAKVVPIWEGFRAYFGLNPLAAVVDDAAFQPADRLLRVKAASVRWAG